MDGSRHWRRRRHLRADRRPHRHRRQQRLSACARRRDRSARALALPHRYAKPKGCLPVDELGPATAKWDYLDASGKLIAVVYRYDRPDARSSSGRGMPSGARWHRRSASALQPAGRWPAGAGGAGRRAKCAQALIDAASWPPRRCTARTPGRENRLVAAGGQGCADLARPRQTGLGVRDAGGAGHPLSAGAKSCHILYPPEEAAEGWDAADAIAEGFDVAAFLPWPALADARRHR